MRVMQTSELDAVLRELQTRRIADIEPPIRPTPAAARAQARTPILPSLAQTPTTPHPIYSRYGVAPTIVRSPPSAASPAHTARPPESKGKDQHQVSPRLAAESVRAQDTANASNNEGKHGTAESALSKPKPTEKSKEKEQEKEQASNMSGPGVTFVPTQPPVVDDPTMPVNGAPPVCSDIAQRRYPYPVPPPPPAVAPPPVPPPAAPLALKEPDPKPSAPQSAGPPPLSAPVPPTPIFAIVRPPPPSRAQEPDSSRSSQRRPSVAGREEVRRPVQRRTTEAGDPRRPNVIEADLRNALRRAMNNQRARASPQVPVKRPEKPLGEATVRLPPPQLEKGGRSTYAGKPEWTNDVAGLVPAAEAQAQAPQSHLQPQRLAVHVAPDFHYDASRGAALAEVAWRQRAFDQAAYCPPSYPLPEPVYAGSHQTDPSWAPTYEESPALPHTQPPPPAQQPLVVYAPSAGPSVEMAPIWPEPFSELPTLLQAERPMRRDPHRASFACDLDQFADSESCESIDDEDDVLCRLIDDEDVLWRPLPLERHRDDFGRTRRQAEVEVEERYMGAMAL